MGDREPAEELRVHGEMTIYRANELAHELLAAVLERGATRLDLSGVTELDAAGLQILLMVRRAAAARGARLDLVHPSHCVEEVLQLCRLTALICTEAERAA